MVYAYLSTVNTINKTSENDIVVFPDCQIPVTQLVKMRTRNYIILGYR